MLDTHEPRTITTVAELQTLVGQELSVSDWLEITQERVNLFADATGDHYFLHLDPERARQTAFGGTIAHGFLTLSLLASSEWQREGVSIALQGSFNVNYGLNRVRFPAPVPVGKRVRRRSKLLAVDLIGEAAVQFTLQETIEIEDEAKPALVAEWLGRTYF